MSLATSAALAIGVIMGTAVTVEAATVQAPDTTLMDSGSFTDAFGMDPGVIAFIEAGTTYSSISVSGNNVTISGMNSSGNFSVWGSGYNFIFEGTNSIDNFCLDEPGMITVSNGTLSINEFYGANILTLGSGTTATPSSISDGGSVTFSGSASSETASSETVYKADPPFKNDTVTVGDHNISSNVPGTFISIAPVAFVNSSDIADLGVGSVLPKPENSSNYSASVSDFNAGFSPSAKNVIDFYSSAYGLNVVNAIDVNLIAPNGTMTWNELNNTSGAASFPLYSAEGIGTLYVNNAMLMVIGIPDGKSVSQIMSITNGGKYFVQTDLDTNPDTVTIYVLPGRSSIAFLG